MIKSLPLPSSKFKGQYYTEWRRTLGKLRAQYLISLDSYAIIMDMDSTESERERALSKIMAYTHIMGYYAGRINYDGLFEFITNDEIWE